VLHETAILKHFILFWRESKGHIALSRAPKCTVLTTAYFYSPMRFHQRDGSHLWLRVQLFISNKKHKRRDKTSSRLLRMAMMGVSMGKTLLLSGEIYIFQEWVQCPLSSL
jgi:hypothetical protein